MNASSITFGDFKHSPADRYLKERYWKFLFDNLTRAVDELYATCEASENSSQCKEVAMVLERCTKDFHGLIERFNLLHNFETAASDKKPSSIAWEIRPPASTSTFSEVHNRGVSMPLSPKVSEMSPRRVGKMSKKPVSTEGCLISPADPQFESEAQILQNLNSGYQILESHPPAIECSLIQVSENKYSNYDEGEWRLVRANKKGRVSRRNERRLFEETDNPELKTESVLPNMLSEGTPVPLINDEVASRSRTSTHSNSNRAKEKYPPLPEFFANAPECDIDMDLSIELDEALISALAAEDELNNELRDELNDSVGCIDVEDLTDDQSDSWLSTSVDSVRIPGRGVELHEKLLSPARRSSEKPPISDHNRTSLAEQLAEKQLRVMDLRERRQKEKIDRCALLSKRVEEVRSWKNELLSEKRKAIESKMKAAEKRRLEQLEIIVRKAHDEEAKGSEIAFINNIEAESRKQEVQAKYAMWRKRLSELSEEQNKRRDAAALRKSATIDRKKALDSERQHRLKEMLQKQKERERKAEERHVEKLQVRVASSRAREKEHEERLAQLRLADEQRAKKLRERITSKQDECARRHLELIEQRRERALALSSQTIQSPRQNSAPTRQHAASISTAPLVIDQRKYCSVCNSVIYTDILLLEHLGSRQHKQSCNLQKNDVFSLASLEAIVPFSTSQQLLLSASLSNFSQKPINESPDSSVERNRQAYKKRAKKFRQQLLGDLKKNDVSELFGFQSKKIDNLVVDLGKSIASCSTNQLLLERLVVVERLVSELTKLIEKLSVADRTDFFLKFTNGFDILGKVAAKYYPLQSQHEPKGVNIKSQGENSDRLINAVLQCYIAIFEMSLESSVYVLCYEPSVVSLILENLTKAVEMLAEISTSTLQLSGPGFDSVAAKSILSIKWAVCFFTSLTAAVTINSKSEEFIGINIHDITRRCLSCVNLLTALRFVDRTAQLVAVASYLTEFSELVVCTFLKALTSLLAASCRLSNACYSADKTTNNDEALLFMASLRFSDLSGVVSLVYALMLKETSLGKPLQFENQNVSTDIPLQVAELVLQAYKFLSSVAALDPVLLQTTLAVDAPLLLQFRQASAFILSQANASNLTSTHTNLIDEVIICVGLFALLNHSLAEGVVTAGQPPTIFQQLVQLPIRYFTDPRLSNILLPTLLSVTFKCDNCLQLLKNDISPHLLIRFLQDQLELTAIAKQSVVADLKLPSIQARFPEKLWNDALLWYTSSI